MDVLTTHVYAFRFNIFILNKDYYIPSRPICYCCMRVLQPCHYPRREILYCCAWYDVEGVLLLLFLFLLLYSPSFILQLLSLLLILLPSQLPLLLPNTFTSFNFQNPSNCSHRHSRCHYVRI